MGPITSLERSPFFDDVILTVGDWSFQIWREGQPKPLFQSGYAAEYYTTGGRVLRWPYFAVAPNWMYALPASHSVNDGRVPAVN